MLKAGPRRTARSGRLASSRVYADDQNEGRMTSYTHARQSDTQTVEEGSNSAITAMKMNIIFLENAVASGYR